MSIAVYENFKSDNKCEMTCREYFTDRQGFLNENAFHKFVDEIKTNADIPDLYLICLNIDLRKANTAGKAAGDYQLRKFVISLENYYVFRIQGEKFNMLVTAEQIDEVETLLKKPNDKYSIYYGIIKDMPFKPSSLSEEKELIRKGIDLMFANKGEIKQGYSIDSIIGDKGNTPKELQETATRKYRSTMWYSEIHIAIKEPFYKEFTVYAFPTEMGGALQSVPTIAVTYDSVQYTVKYDKQVKFGILGVIFNLNCRFDREGKLATTIFTLDKNCKCDININTFEGECIPATFGKRITATKQIFPIRKNATGMCDYVALEDGKVTLDTEGVVVSPNGNRYGVYMDDKCIDLIKL